MSLIQAEREFMSLFDRFENQMTVVVLYVIENNKKRKMHCLCFIL